MKNVNVIAIQENPIVGAIDYNKEIILNEIKKVDKEYTLLVFPECFLSGYPVEDLVLRDSFMNKITQACDEIMDVVKTLNVNNFMLTFGSPWKTNNYNLHNAAIVITKNHVEVSMFAIPKTVLPNTNVFDEKRYFETSASINGYNGKQTFWFGGQHIMICICEDIWHDTLVNKYKDKLDDIIDLIVVLNGSPFEVNKEKQRIEVATKFKQGFNASNLLYLNLVGGQDELVFDGNSFLLNNYDELYFAESFKTDNIEFSLDDTGIPKNIIQTKCLHNAIDNTGLINLDLVDMFDRNKCSDIYSALVLGLRDYLKKGNGSHVFIGNSGGIDSAFALTVAVDAVGPDNVTSICMPYHFTSDQTLSDADDLARNLGVTHIVHDISDAVDSRIDQFEALTPDNYLTSVAIENFQARERGVVLMGYANCTPGGIVISTGNKSEMSVGYATLYGDMCGGFNVNKDLYKTELYECARWRNNNLPTNHSKLNVIPENILTKAPTAELAEDQKDSDSLPEYEYLDTILYLLIDKEMSVSETVKQMYGLHNDLPVVYQHEPTMTAIVNDIANKVFHTTEYKRRQSPPGIKISERNFGRGRRYPITNKFYE